MNEIDRELDAAWRAASREEPSPMLDQTIRAAARREVGAGPRRDVRTRVWLPLAAAATVAVLAIGIAQLTPPERVSPDIAADMRSETGADKLAANEAPPSPAQAAAQAESDVNARDAARSDKPAKLQGPVLETRKEKPASPTAEEQAATRTRDRADAAQNVTAERAAAQPVERENKKKSELASAAATAPSSDAAPAAGTSHSVPFPASPPREKLAEQGTPPPAAAPSPPAAPAAGGVASNAEPTAERRMAMAKPAVAEAHRDENVAARSVDEWVKQIRRLIAEGKRDDAAKELTAFRALYKERADSLLPTDLREFKR